MVLDFGLFSGDFPHQNNLCRTGTDLPASTISCETSEQVSYSSTSVLVKLTCTGAEGGGRKTKSKKDKARQGKGRQGTIKSL